MSRNKKWKKKRYSSSCFLYSSFLSRKRFLGAFNLLETTFWYNFFTIHFCCSFCPAFLIFFITIRSSAFCALVPHNIYIKIRRLFFFSLNDYLIGGFHLCKNNFFLSLFWWDTIKSLLYEYNLNPFFVSGIKSRHDPLSRKQNIENHGKEKKKENREKNLILKQSLGEIKCDAESNIKIQVVTR